MDNVVHIYTDGACKGNPGPGGWGAWLVYGLKELEICGGDPDTTNNRMELQAVIEALSRLTRPCDVVITVDSTYVLNGAEKWMHKWKANNWTKKGGIMNLDLWQELDQIMEPHTITWQWVRGHDGNPGNERADLLANRGISKII